MGSAERAGALRGLVRSTDLILLCLSLSAFTVLGPVYDGHLEDALTCHQREDKKYAGEADVSRECPSSGS